MINKLLIVIFAALAIGIAPVPNQCSSDGLAALPYAKSACAAPAKIPKKPKSKKPKKPKDSKKKRSGKTQQKKASFRKKTLNTGGNSKKTASSATPRKSTQSNISGNFNFKTNAHLSSNAKGRYGEAKLKKKLGGLGSNKQFALNTPLGKRFPDRVVFGVAHEVKFAKVRNTKQIRTQIAKDAKLKEMGRKALAAQRNSPKGARKSSAGKKKSNQIIRDVHWHFMSGKQNVSPKVLQLLKDNNIPYSFGMQWNNGGKPGQ